MRNLIKIIYLNLRKFFLYGFHHLLYFKKCLNKKIEGNIKTILFIRIDRIGDLVLSTPTIKALKKSYPRSKIIVLASKSNYAVLKNNPDVDNTLIYNSQTSFSEKLNVIKQLRNYNFDLAIDPYAGYELNTALISLLSGARERIGFSSYGREVLFNNSVSQPTKNKHFVDITIEILKPLNIKVREKSPQIYIADKELEWSKNWIKQKLKSEKPIIGIHPGAYYESQRWIIDNFAELISGLQKDAEFEIIIFGGPTDEQFIKGIISLITKRPIVFESRNIRKFISTLSYCKLLICNNSGPLHIAVATEIPTISFMGPTVKESWKPLGDIHKVLRVDDLPCIGCNSGICKISTHDCMNLITPSEVLKTIYSKIDKSFNVKIPPFSHSSHFEPP